MKTLIVYYSLEGSTKAMAEAIQKKTGGDLLELKPIKDVNPKGFMKYVFGGRQAMMKSKPDLMPYDVDLSIYDTIILGTPVWAFTFAPPLLTFMKKEQITGKKLAFFACHEGSPGKTLKHFEDALGGNNEVIGKLEVLNPLRETERCRLEVERWVEGMRL